MAQALEDEVREEEDARGEVARVHAELHSHRVRLLNPQHDDDEARDALPLLVRGETARREPRARFTTGTRAGTCSESGGTGTLLSLTWRNFSMREFEGGQSVVPTHW